MSVLQSLHFFRIPEARATTILVHVLQTTLLDQLIMTSQLPIALFGTAMGRVDSPPAAPLTAAACAVHMHRRLSAAFGVLRF